MAREYAKLLAVSQIRLGELMLKANLLTGAQLHAGLRAAQVQDLPLSIALNQLFSISSARLFDELAIAIGLPRHEVLGERPTAEALDLIDRAWALQNRIIPVRFSYNMGELEIALCDPTETGAIDYLRSQAQCKLKAELASDDEINLLLQTIYGEQANPVAAARIPSQAFVQVDAGLENSMRIQDMDEMRDQLNQGDQAFAASRSAAERQLSLRAGSAPKPLPLDALMPLDQNGFPQQPNVIPNLLIPGNTPESPSVSAAEINWSRLIQVNEDASQVLEAVFELCVQSGIFTKEEYLRRLQERD